MLGRAILALAAMEVRKAARRRLRKWLPALFSRPPGLTHRDAERIAEASRRAGREDAVERDP